MASDTHDQPSLEQADSGVMTRKQYEAWLAEHPEEAKSEDAKEVLRKYGCCQ